MPPGSQTHLTEFFGPLLGVMRAENLKQAVDLVNQTGYGLTSGIESLDRREQAFWQERVQAGNLYINRGTTGASVLRQPFGGMGKSALGAGIKVGGPHYVTQFLEAEDAAAPSTGPLTRPHPLLRLAQRWQLGLDGEKFGAEAGDIRKIILAIRSYLYHVEREFGRELDHVNLRGQDNVLRHLPVGTVAVRLHPADTLFDALARIAAVKATGNRLRVSVPKALDTPAARFLYGPEGLRLTGRDPVFQESDADLIAGMPDARPHPLRRAGPCPARRVRGGRRNRLLHRTRAGRHGGPHRAAPVLPPAECLHQLPPLRQPRFPGERLFRGLTLAIAFKRIL